MMVGYCRMSFTPLGDALHKTIGTNATMRRQIEASDVVVYAEGVFLDMFGQESKHVKPLFLKNRTLTITCASSVIAQEIRMNQAAIVEKINQKMGKNEVDRIRYLA